VSPHRLRFPIFSLPLLILLALAFGQGALRADTIYTNFGTGDTYDAGAGVMVTSDGMAWSSVAVAFTPVANYNLASIEFVVSDLIPNDTSDVTLGIFTDNNGEPGGAPLELFSVNPSGTFGQNLPVTTVTSILQPLLLADTQYWVGMNAAPGDLVAWNQNVTSANGFSQTDGLGNWSPSDRLQAQGVLEVDGTLSAIQPPVAAGDASVATPEPRTWLLVAGGFGALVLFRRRFRTVRRLGSCGPRRP
jgi:hypothetical protein